MRELKNLLSFIINLIFPHTCLSCKCFTRHNYYTGFCLDCLKETEEFDIAKQPGLTEFIKQSYIDSFNARFIYNDIIAKAILEFKFHDSPQSGKHLAKLLKNLAISNKDTLIVPVPLHTKRLLTRKYNQSSILAKQLSKELGLKYSNKALQRIKNTPHQTGQSAKIRKEQLNKAFLADKNIVKNKEIILIDDVFTTGSTVNLCAKELKEAGALKVNVITIAYTQA